MKNLTWNTNNNMLSIGGRRGDDDDDDEGRINFKVALSGKTTRTRNNKLKQLSHVIVVSGMRRC